MTGRVRLLVAALALIPSLPLVAGFWLLDCEGESDPAEDFPSDSARGAQSGGSTTNPTK